MSQTFLKEINQDLGCQYNIDSWFLSLLWNLFFPSVVTFDSTRHLPLSLVRTRTQLLGCKTCIETIRAAHTESKEVDRFASRHKTLVFLLVFMPGMVFFDFMVVAFCFLRCKVYTCVRCVMIQRGGAVYRVHFYLLRMGGPLSAASRGLDIGIGGK